MIKSVIKEVVDIANIQYPCLMISAINTIVLFASEGVGIVVVGNNSHKVGYYSDSWAYSEFKPFTGTVELSND